MTLKVGGIIILLSVLAMIRFIRLARLVLQFGGLDFVLQRFIILLAVWVLFKIVLQKISIQLQVSV